MTRLGERVGGKTQKELSYLYIYPCPPKAGSRRERPLALKYISSVCYQSFIWADVPQKVLANSNTKPFIKAEGHFCTLKMPRQDKK